MIGVGAGLAIGAGVSALGGLVSTFLNNRSVSSENEIMREREDNAISRRMADLERNGLSPTLAAGSPASSQSGVAKNYDGISKAFDYANNYMGLLQGKASIEKSNADSALAQMQATSEQFKQAFMSAQTKGENLRNSWINQEKILDVALKRAQTDVQRQQLGKISAEIERLNADTALLGAKTAYEQANTDFLATQKENLIQNTENLKIQNALGLVQTDNAKINRDMLINSRSWTDALNASQVWRNVSSGGLLSSVPGAIIGGSGILERYFPGLSFDNQRDSWYYPSR